MDEVTEKVLQRLEALGGQLADTTQQALEVYTRQAFVEGVFGLSVALVSLVVLIITVFFGVKIALKGINIEKRKDQHMANCDICRKRHAPAGHRVICSDFPNEDTFWTVLATVTLGIVSFIAFIFFAANIGDIVQVINPEYYAIQDLVEQVRSGSN